MRKSFVLLTKSVVSLMYDLLFLAAGFKKQSDSTATVGPRGGKDSNNLCILGSQLNAEDLLPSDSIASSKNRNNLVFLQ